MTATVDDLSPTIPNAPPFEDVCDFRRVMVELEIAEPRPRAKAHIWKWQDMRDRLLGHEGFDLTTVHRRAFALCNPGLGGRPHAATTLFASLSVYYPGDRAPVHRHSASASRFALEGLGGFTNVAGEKLVMRRGDLVITPNGEWHDHGNEGSEPVFWVDVLDVPLLEHLNCIMTEWDYPGAGEDGAAVRAQPVSKRDDHSARLFASAGVVPRSGWEDRDHRLFSPKYVYRAEDVRRAQEALRDEPGSVYDGIMVEYVDPTRGTSVVPTLSFRSQLLRPGEKTRAQRSTASAVYCVLEGSGVTIVGDERLEWSVNDLFVIPPWTWFQHENMAADAVLYSVSDLPTQIKLGVHRAQGRGADGEVIELTRWPAVA